MTDDVVLQEQLEKKYDAGFTTNVEAETLPPGLDENTIRKISQIKKEPKWLLEFRLKAFNRWKVLKDPDWADLDIEPIDYQKISYYSAPKKGPASYDEVDPEIKKDFFPGILEAPDALVLWSTFFPSVFSFLVVCFVTG